MLYYYHRIKQLKLLRYYNNNIITYEIIKIMNALPIFKRRNNKTNKNNPSVGMVYYSILL